MRSLLRDAEHLVRLALLFAVGVGLFLIVRALLVPPGFGELGHFRTGAIADNQTRSPLYAGRDACAECHGEVAEALAGDAHSGVGCESCHGALATHVADPDASKPALPDASGLCALCHQELAARPAGHPQVDVAAHAEGEACTDCHAPHAPAP
jgi:hypothetical protein